MNEPVHRHHWIVRLTHWSAFALIFGMIASGLQIYRAYPRFGERGGPYYPNIFQDLAFPEWTRLGGWLAGGLNWHFFFMWPLIGNWRSLPWLPSGVGRVEEAGLSTA